MNPQHGGTTLLPNFKKISFSQTCVLYFQINAVLFLAFTCKLVLVFFLGGAVTQFISKPPDQWKVLAGQNITFVWRYSLDGTIDSARFVNITGGASIMILMNIVGTTIVVPNFQQRFTANISDTEATITMLAVKRSDQGKFEFDVTTSNGGLLHHDVELIVPCK